MDLDELDALLGDARDVLRVETLDGYALRADGGDVDRYLRGDPPASRTPPPWVEAVADAVARGLRRRRLRLVRRPMPYYVRFCCAWRYTATTALGEEVALLDQRRDAAAFAWARSLGDLYRVDDRTVFLEHDALGRLVRAFEPAADADATTWLPLADQWQVAEPFTAWWAAESAP
ncbi:MAG TPA: hypothetical protein VK935_23220 [Actinomycetospora sp.]|nr:hypothetical protein [Actinomycetospora sp.]